MNNFLSIGWWNTGLAPFSNKAVSDEDKETVVSVIKNLILEKKIGFLAVGEVSQLDFEYIKDRCSDLDGYEFLSGVSKVGKTNFDTLFIYNPYVFRLIDKRDITKIQSGNTFKIAQRIDLLENKNEEVIHIFVSHWPSRLYCEESSSIRHQLSMRLRDAVDELFEIYDKTPHIVLMGDYNDEPFSKPLSEQLKATRDIGLLKKKKSMFFNPYWDYLGGKIDGSSLTGSYFYKSGKYSEWHTFDQIIFSSAFFECSGWTLSDKSEHFVNISYYTDQVKSRISRFDHLPISALIERK